MFAFLLVIWFIFLTYITFVLHAFTKARDFNFALSLKTSFKVPIVLLRVHHRLAKESYQNERDLKRSFIILFKAIYDYNASLTFIYTIISYGIGEIRATGNSSILTRVDKRSRKRVNGYSKLGNSFGNFKNVLNSEGYKDQFA